MSPATLNTIHAQLTQLTALVTEAINQPQASEVTQHVIPEASITLQAGERYAGPVLDSDGAIKHHLVLMAQRPDGDLDWDDAMAWAAEVGGVLPSRQEQSILFANCKPHLKPVWHWSGEQHEDDASYAWVCSFNFGYQFSTRKSAEGAAVAVRRVSA